MANKKRRKRPRPPAADRSGEAPRGGANVERRERKDLARQTREQARKQVARRERSRRAAIILAVGAAGFAVVWLIGRGAPPEHLADAAQAAAEAAGCVGPVRVLGDNPPGGQHLAPGASTTYAQRPATSGQHATQPLPPDPNVYGAPVDETQAVHFMEHSGILLYYRQGTVPQEVVDRLADVANEGRNTIMAPFPDLPDGQDLAFATWNRLLTCPAAVSADQAGTIARGFVEAFACTSVGPEPNASPEC